MVNSIVLLAILGIIAGCAIFQYLKGSFVKAFAMAIAAVCASAIAIGFFAILAKALVSISGGNDLLEKWGALLCFVLLFVVAFAGLQTLTNFLTTRQPIDLGLWPERIGRVFCGIFLGFVLSRALIIALTMALPDTLQSSTIAKYLGHKGIVIKQQKELEKSENPAQSEKSQQR